MKPADLISFLAIVAVTAGEEVRVAELFEPKLRLKLKSASTNQGKVERVGTNSHIKGDSPLHLRIIPGTGEKWELSTHRLAGLRVTNNGGGIVTLGGKLQNSQPTG